MFEICVFFRLFVKYATSSECFSFHLLPGYGSLEPEDRGLLQPCILSKFDRSGGTPYSANSLVFLLVVSRCL